MGFQLVYPGSAVVLMHSGTRILPQDQQPSLVSALWKPTKCDLNMKVITQAPPLHNLLSWDISERWDINVKGEALRSIAPTADPALSSVSILQITAPLYIILKVRMTTLLATLSLAEY